MPKVKEIEIALPTYDILTATNCLARLHEIHHELVSFSLRVNASFRALDWKREHI